MKRSIQERPLKHVSGSSNSDTSFLPHCTNFCSVLLGYWIKDLMRISKMCLNLPFCNSNWVLQEILYLIVLKSMFLAVQILTPVSYLTVPIFVVFY